jgi:hypothetical protein
MKDERPDDIVVTRLAQLREEMADFDAPPRVKPAVMHAFRASAAKPRRPRTLWWAAIAACAAGLAAGLYWLPRGEEVPPVAPPSIAAVMRPPVLERVPDVPQRAVKARVRLRVVARRHAAPHAPPPQGIATDFLALPYAPPLDPGDGGQVVRVRLPRAAMRIVGLPVNEDRWYERVPADVVLGQDGIARAVRFVNFAQ